MKIIVAGSTGFVATEVIRQALSNPAVTSIVALARQNTAAPENVGPRADVTKLKSVVCDNFEKYSDSVKKEIAGADACIWLIGITPSRLKTVTWEEVRKICVDYTVTGIETMSQGPRDPGSKPFRFIYTSGDKSERDQTKKPWILGDYCLLRGETETRVLDFAKGSKGAVEACITKPGLIDAPGRTGLVMGAVRTVFTTLIGLPKVEVSEIAATLLEQVVNGIESETLYNDDLIRIGRKALVSEQNES